MVRFTLPSSSAISRIAQFVCLATLCAGASAQTANSAVQSLKPIAQVNRVPASPNFGPQSQLHTTLPNWTSADRQIAGNPVDLTSKVGLQIVLQRDPAVQAAFEQMLADQQTPGSPMYHQWLTPQQVGVLYGPTKDDIAAVTSWLAAQGVTVDQVAPSGMIIDATGTAESVGNAFHVSFANFTVSNNVRRGVMAQPSIPAVLTPVISDVNGLNEVIAEPQSHGVAMKAPQSPDGVHPNLTNGSTHYLSPADFQTIYDITSVTGGLADSGNIGATIGAAAQHVAIIGRSRVVATDISEFVTNTGLAHENLNTIIPPAGSDPGTPLNADTGEATLDVNRVIGVANGAQADLVVSATGSSDGIYIASSYNVNTLVDKVMTISFGQCEVNGGSSGVTLWDTLFSSAAAEGISTIVSSGDSGAAGCDAGNAAAPATTQVLSPNYICASSYATCVGGTEFADTASPSTYWSSSNATGLSSALSYIPEGAWNEPLSAAPFFVQSTGGGVSSYITKPSWQTGTGVPADGHRDTPDVAFSAAGHDGYYSCLAPGGDCSTGHFTAFQGTSAAAPGMAGIAALLNTKMGVAQGNLNPLIYRLATKSYGSVFHDATPTSSGVGACALTTPSMCNNSTPTNTSLTGGLAGYALTTGYDQATGWGSLDVANFLNAAAALASGINLGVVSTHTGNFKASDVGDTYTLTVSNLGSTASSGTITVVDTLPSGFTATAMSGTNWSCTLGTLTCTSTTAIAGNASGSPITLTVNVSSGDAGLYANSVSVSGGGATGTISSVDETSVIVPPTLTIAFSPSSIAANGTSTLTFTFTNPSTNAVSLTGVAFTNTLPAGLTSGTPTASCTSGSTYTYGYNSTIAQISLGTLAANGSCTYVVTVSAGAGPNYVDTTSTITTTNSNAGAAATATLYVQITPTISWTPSSHTGYINTAIGAGVLDASSTAVGGGTFAYTATNSVPATVGITSASTLAAGTYTLTATFTPTNTSQYTTNTSTISFTVVKQAVFVLLSGGNAASFYDSGSSQSSATGGGGIGAAVDANGKIWSINTNGLGVTLFTDAGAFSTSYTGSGISGAKALAVDGNNQTWIANGNGTISALSNAGANALTVPIDPAGGTAAPASISVDTAGSLWLAIPNTTTPSSSTVVEVIGSAAPISTPTVSQVINSTPGTKP